MRGVRGVRRVKGVRARPTPHVRRRPAYLMGQWMASASVAFKVRAVSGRRMPSVAAAVMRGGDEEGNATTTTTTTTLASPPPSRLPRPARACPLLGEAVLQLQGRGRSQLPM